MGFVKERANAKDIRQIEDWKHIQNLGIKNIWGRFDWTEFL